MRFIIDAHLPRYVAEIFKELGQEAIHTSELPEGNASKDEDFYQSFLLYGRPSQFIYVKVGNMRLRELKELFSKVAPKLIDLLGQHDLLELHRDKIIVIA